MEEIKTTDLMYAAFLVTLGGQVIHYENCGRYTKLTVQVPDYSIRVGKDKSDRLHRLFNRAESSKELPIIYEQCLIKSISDAYFNIKKSIIRSKK